LTVNYTLKTQLDHIDHTLPWLNWCDYSADMSDLTCPVQCSQ